jgi:serine/threonine-protein phosphatase 2A regulatory subunit A
MQGIDSCVCLAGKLPLAKVNAQVLPYVKKFAEDKSWRIRYLIADRIMDLASAIGFDHAKDNLLPHFCNFLGDSESEVRTAAVGRVSDFTKILDANNIVTKIIPCLKKL